MPPRSRTGVHTALGVPAPATSRTPALALGLAIALGLALLLSVAACGGTAATDVNEPNDEVNAATSLVAGLPLEGSLTAGDSDVFGSEAPAGPGAHRFVVTVACDDPAGVEVSVGASIPGVWEGITWPGWKPVAGDERITVAGDLGKGTVLVFIRGTAGARYTVGITWE